MSIDGVPRAPQAWMPPSLPWWRTANWALVIGAAGASLALVVLILYISASGAGPGPYCGSALGQGMCV